MKKLIVLLSMFCITLTSNVAVANELAEHLNTESQEAFFNDFNEKFDASQKQVAKLLKRSDSFLDKRFGKHAQMMKEKQADLLFDLGLDHASTTREILTVLTSEEAQVTMNQKMLEQIEANGGFEAYTERLNSNEKGVFRFIGDVIVSILFFPVFLIWIVFYPGGWC